MSFTRKYTDFLSNGFKKIGKFTISPWTWAVKSLEEAEDKANLENNYLAAGICLACGCAICCCKTPVACVASLVTFPVGGTTALIFGVVGVTAYPVTLTMDAVSACCGEKKEKTETITQQVSESPEMIGPRL